MPLSTGVPRATRAPRPWARAAAVGGAIALTSLAAPAPALAHGLFLTPALPIPVWLFAAVTGLVVVASFAAAGLLWRRPKLDRRSWRPFAPAVGRALASRAMDIPASVVGVAVLVLVIYAGLRGTRDNDKNFASVFVFSVFWPGVPLIQLVFGDVFRAFNPWRALGRAIDWLNARLVGTGDRPVEPLLRYPTWLGRYPAAVGLFGFAFLELASARSPRDVALSAAVYTALSVPLMWLFGGERWCSRGETFSAYFNLFARIGVLERRGSRLGARRALSALVDLPRLPGTVALAAVMIGAVSFDGASGSRLWESIAGDIQPVFTSVGLSGLAASELTSAVGIIAFSLLALGVYFTGVVGVRVLTEPRPAGALARVFAPSLVPIALAYLIAHNLTLLVIGGQSVITTLSDPLGVGANILGTARFKPDDSILSANAFWYLEVGAILLGHVAAVLLAHDIALVAFARVREALRSQYVMLLVMVAFSVFALWLLKEASEL